MTYRVSFATPGFEKSFRGLSRDMDRALGELFSLDASPAGTVQPVSDIVEDESGWTLTLEVPGVRPDGVEVLTEDRTLTVRATRANEALKEGAKRVAHERAAGVFSRQFRLPKTADVENITATIDLGLLSIRIGKLAPAQPRRVPVTNQAPDEVETPTASA